MTSTRFSRWWPALLLGGYAFCLFWQYFLLDQTLYAGDTAFVLLPFHHFATSYLKQGLLPLWNPHLFGGTPALAEAQYQVFYPPNLLFFVTGVARGTGWMLPLHLTFMGVGTYLFARRSLSLCRSASLLAALAFAFGGCIQSRLAVSVFTEAAAWMPWMLLWYDRARREGGVALALPGIALAMQILTGAPQYAFYSLALLMVYHLFYPRESVVDGQHQALNGRAWLALVATLILGVVLCAAQIVPQWELARLSDRSTRATFEYATQFSLAPIHFVTTMLFPKFYGLFTTAPVDNFYPGEETGYMGIAALCLLGAALVASRPRRQVVFWGVTLLLSLSFAFGKYNPLYSALYEYVPGFAMFRAPGRWLLITSFCGAMLAAFGLQAVLVEETRKVALRVALAMTCLLLLVGIVTLLSPFGVSALAIPQSPYNAWGQLVLCAVTALLLGFWALRENSHLARRAPAMLLVLLAVDLFALSQDMEMQNTLSVEAVETRPQSAVHLQSAGFQERFWPGDAQIPMERWQINDTTTSPLQFRATNAAAMRALMPSCVPAEFQTAGLTGAWGALMPLRRHARPIYQANTPEAVRQKWLRLLNVRHYLALRPLATEQLELQSSEPLYLYRDEQAMPRAFWVGSVRRVESNAAEHTVSSTQFDPQREVVLEYDGNSAIDAPTSRTARTAAGVQAFVPAQVVNYTATQFTLQATVPAPGHMVVMETLYPGWKASVDGQPVPMYPANWVGRAVPVSAGEHNVRMHFDPQSVRFGIFISLLALALIGGMASVAFQKKRHT